MSDMTEKTLRMMSRLGRLESLPRTGWLFSGVSSPESVAAHAYEVVTLAIWLADAVPDEVDLGRLVRIAAAHDAGEALLTDLPRPVKAFIGRDAVKRAERDATAVVFEGGESAWLEAFDAYEAGESTEARLVKAADRIQMLVRASQYARQGRADVARFFEGWDGGDFGFELVGEILTELHDRYARGEWYASDVD